MLHYIYYRCTKKKNPNCTQKYVKVEELERQYNEELLKLNIDEDYLKLALDYLNSEQELEVRAENAVKDSWQEIIDDCDTRLQNLHREYTSSQNTNYELLSPEDFKRQKSEILSQRAHAQQQLSQTREKIDRTLELSERTFNFCAYASYHFKNGTMQRKREIFSSIGSNLTLKDGILHIEALEPYMFIK